MAVASDLIVARAAGGGDNRDRCAVLDKDGLLKEAIEDLMASALREAVVLDDDGFAIGIVTRSDVAVHPRRKVVLVDHNETRQAANGIEEADVVEIVDHHRIADVMTANPIMFLNLPVGSTATIVAMEFRRHGVDMPPAIARVLLSAVMTDTVILKSPTATDADREMVDYLCRCRAGGPRGVRAVHLRAAVATPTFLSTSSSAPTPRSSRSATPPCSSRSTKRWTFLR
ncbi:MAG: DHH family phosphoesterase [Eggerthellaceae bacterium]